MYHVIRFLWRQWAGIQPTKKQETIADSLPGGAAVGRLVFVLHSKLFPLHMPLGQ